MDRELWRAMQDRVPFRVARRLLAQNGFPKGSSWAAIEKKLKDRQIATAADFAGLLASYRETLVASEKSLRLYSLSPANMRALRAAAEAARPAAKNAFAQSFPYPLADAQLRAMLLGPAKVAGKVAVRSGECLIFSSIRETAHRETIPLSQIARSAGDGFSVVYGVRIERTQSFAAVLVPARGNKVSVLVDAPLRATIEVRAASHSLVRDAVNSLGGSEVLRRPINLYPLIKSLYNSQEGTITHFSYTTTTSSEKQERMRGSGKCLRAEIAHKTGMAALGWDVQAYELEMAWQLPKVHSYLPQPEIAIKGTYGMTYERDAEVDEALISKCGSIAEVEFVLGRLLAVARAAAAAR